MAPGGKEKRAEQLGARSEERGTREATSILTTFLETSLAVSRGLEKGGRGETGHPPSDSSFFFALTRCVLNHFSVPSFAD